jgi:hypothetical protein
LLNNAEGAKVAQISADRGEFRLAAKKPRTECGCQPVQVMIVAMVAPLCCADRLNVESRPSIRAGDVGSSP